MRIIGITGSLGSGKTTVAAMLADLGAKVIDADRIAHRVMQPDSSCLRKIVKHFGRGILANGYIDRKKLAQIVFNDPKRLHTLIRIIHPKVKEEIKRKVVAYRKLRRVSVVALDVPLLFESGLDRWVDLTVVVKVRSSQQIERIRRRLSLTESEAFKRIKAQMPLKEKIRLADVIIDNTGSLTKTKKQVEKLWQKLTQKKNKK